jgi:hypothetical protein
MYIVFHKISEISTVLSQYVSGVIPLPADHPNGIFYQRVFAKDKDPVLRFVVDSFNIEAHAFNNISNPLLF